MNLNVRISGALSDYVNDEITKGAYENVSEYICDLIRKEKERSEIASFETMRAELQHAFSTPDSELVKLTAKDIFKRNADKLTNG